MTERLRAAAQALVNRWDSPQWGGSAENLRHTGEYIAELRAALAEQPAEQEPEGSVCGRCGGLVFDPILPQPDKPAEQEPFGYLYPTGTHPEFRFFQNKRDGVDGMPLYTAPQPAKRVPLTDEEISALWLDSISGPLTATKFARAVERAHGITGETK